MSEDDEMMQEQQDIKSLRKAAEAGKQAQNELAEMKRELLFAKAGIDTGSKIGKLLFKTWDGEDLDSLKTEAADLGIGGVEAPRNTGVEAEERGQQDVRQTFAKGNVGAPSEVPERDPFDEAYDLFHEARKRGTTMDDAGLAAIDRVLVAAASGDKRAIFDPNDWANQARSIGHRFDR